MSVVGMILMVMGVYEDIASTKGMILVLCGFLLLMMGALRLYICSRLFREDNDENNEMS